MNKGLTLIEIIVAVAVVVILMGVYFLAANPAGQLASARNSRRLSDLQLIGNTIRENYTDAGNGTFTCSSGPIPASTTDMASASGSYNIAPCIVLSQYGLYSMPYDPNATSAYYNTVGDYNSGYSIMINSSGSIILTAPYAELGKAISVTR
ncbi:MAG: prepilin-type N-terminal cleavage/methylation domain-containing protein [Patescibacteria group bacterium]|nr:prepilin-type N-terminal cleavage/methylation domain-containing protein [Patescibacteria group bacterium]